jgi:hypothetical protein
MVKRRHSGWLFRLHGGAGRSALFGHEQSLFRCAELSNSVAAPGGRPVS